MTPADRAAAVAAAERMVSEPWPEWDVDPPLVARAVLDLAATVERVEALCAKLAARGGYLVLIEHVRAALAGPAEPTGGSDE